MISIIGITFYVGGMCAAFDKERGHGAARLTAAIAAVMWPSEIGKALVQRFYVNDKWPDDRRV